MDDFSKSPRRQRQFLRIACAIPVSIVCLKPDGRVPHDGWVRGEIVEIGGGGARIEADVPAESGDVLSLQFHTPDTEEKMNLHARVVDLSTPGAPGRICTKFVGLSSSDQARLIRYAFREQIRLAKALDEAARAGDQRESNGEIDH